MLKKSDLAKQFELVVKQEIKNYQDSLNFVLESLRSLSIQIQQVKDQSLENHAKIQNLHSDLAIDLQLLEKAHNENFEYIFSKLNDQDVLNEKKSKELDEISKFASQNASLENLVRAKLHTLESDLNKNKQVTEFNILKLNRSLDDLLTKIRLEIQQAKKEIIESPTEASFVRKDLEEKIACHKVDVEGIMRELLIYKKENYISQKKIENIYTLIERLKPGEK